MRALSRHVLPIAVLLVVSAAAWLQQPAIAGAIADEDVRMALEMGAGTALLSLGYFSLWQIDKRRSRT